MADTSGSSPADVPPPPPPHHVHGNLGVHYGGCWVDIEDLGKAWAPPRTRWSCDTRVPPPPPVTEGYDADVVVIGAGCVGSSISRELSKFKLRVLLLEKSDDVTQGATKGNSGIVHAGYDDVPGTRRAEFCWQGNQVRFRFPTAGPPAFLFDWLLPWKLSFDGRGEFCLKSYPGCHIFRVIE